MTGFGVLLQSGLPDVSVHGNLDSMPHNGHRNGDTPATHADLALLAGEMALRFDGVNSELKEIRGDIARLQRGQEAILNVVTSIDEQLRELKSLPARVERLERSRR